MFWPPERYCCSSIQRAFSSWIPTWLLIFGTEPSYTCILCWANRCESVAGSIFIHPMNCIWTLHDRHLLNVDQIWCPMETSNPLCFEFIPYADVHICVTWISLPFAAEDEWLFLYGAGVYISFCVLTKLTMWIAYSFALHATEGGEQGEDLKYSRGVRQMMFKLFSQDQGFIIQRGKTPSYSQQMCNSVFGLSPLGSGQSPRTLDAIMHGSIPVIIQVLDQG